MADIAMGGHWTMEDVPWDAFDGSKVNPDIIKLVKAASLVEHNGGDYTHYLCNVFADDPDFQIEAQRWGREEIQHGKVLARWAEMADPDFDFEKSFQRFLDGYRIPLDATESVRGSKTGELVARCIVETGTSSFYSALADATDEPVLKNICRRIAGDEFRHYKLFYDYVRDYVRAEKLSPFKRLTIALGRINEAEDDELSYAYYAANIAESVTYDREECHKLYMAPVYRHYRRVHMDRAVAMIAKAVGIRLWEPVRRFLSSVALKHIHRRADRFMHTTS